MARNPVYEQALTKEGVEWKYVEEMSMEDINLPAGLRNQARLEQALIPGLVESYAKAKRDGAEFPAPVVYRMSERGKYCPIDGNQRLAADTANRRKTTDAYVVETRDQLVIDRLTWTFNQLVNGRRLSEAECLQHAISLVRKHGMTANAAANQFGLHKSAVDKAVRVAELRDVLAQHKVKVTPTLNDGKLVRLAPIQSAGEDVFCAAAKAAMETDAGEKEILELASEVRAAKTQEAKVKAVETWRNSETAKARAAVTKGGKEPMPKALPRDVLRAQVRKIERLFADYPYAGLKPAGPTYKEDRATAAGVVDNLIILFGLGAKVSRQEEAS